MQPARITGAAVPGQPNIATPLPPGAPGRALAALAALSRQLGRRDIPACARRDPIAAQWDAPRGQLLVTIDDPDAWARGTATCRTITWQWGRLWDWSDGWYVPGWHASADVTGLAEDWRALLDRALQRDLRG